MFFALVVSGFMGADECTLEVDLDGVFDQVDFDVVADMAHAHSVAGAGEGHVASRVHLADDRHPDQALLYPRYPAYALSPDLGLLVFGVAAGMGNTRNCPSCSGAARGDALTRGPLAPVLWRNYRLWWWESAEP